MAKDIRKPSKIMRDNISPKTSTEDKGRFRGACIESEKETIGKCKEFVSKISEQDEWALEDWAELAELAEVGRTLMEMRIAMT